jgi:hypothetical protein
MSLDLSINAEFDIREDTEGEHICAFYFNSGNALKRDIEYRVGGSFRLAAIQPFPRDSYPILALVESVETEIQ